jgi:hypothetical protein
VTEHLAAHSIGLPFFRDITDRQIGQVVEAIVPHLAGNSCPSPAAYPVGDVIPGSV